MRTSVDVRIWVLSVWAGADVCLSRIYVSPREIGAKQHTEPQHFILKHNAAFKYGSLIVGCV